MAGGKGMSECPSNGRISAVADRGITPFGGGFAQIARTNASHKNDPGRKPAL